MISSTVHALVAAQAKMGHSISENQGVVADAANERASAAKERAIEEQVKAAEDRADAGLIQALVSIGMTIASTIATVCTAGAAAPGAAAATAATQASTQTANAAAQAGTAITVETVKQAATKAAEVVAQTAAKEAIKQAVIQGGIQLTGNAASQIPRYFLERSAAEADLAAARQEALSAKFTERRDQSQKVADETHQAVQRQIDTAINQSDRMLDITKYV